MAPLFCNPVVARANGDGYHLGICVSMAGILPIPRRCCNGTAEEHDSIPTARTALGIAQRWAGN
ncbi:MAG: hypothetical protein V2A73_19605, partial [Pseudomonadota bacterium]